MPITKEMFEKFIADNNRFFLEGTSESDNIIYLFSKMPIADKEHRVDAIYFVPIYPRVDYNSTNRDIVKLNHSAMNLLALVVDGKETYSVSPNYRYLFGAPSIECNSLNLEMKKAAAAFITAQLSDSDLADEQIARNAKKQALKAYITGTDFGNLEQHLIAKSRNMIDITMVAGFLAEPSVWGEKYLSNDTVQTYKWYAAIYTLIPNYLSKYEADSKSIETEFRNIEAVIKNFPTVRLFFELPDGTPINFIYNTKSLESMFFDYQENEPVSIHMYGCCERNSVVQQISASLVGHGCCNQKEIPFRCLTKIKHGNSTLWQKEE